MAEMSATACRSIRDGEDGFGILGSLSKLELTRMSSERLLGKGGGIRLVSSKDLTTSKCADV